MTNEQLIHTVKEAMRNDTALNKGMVELLCNALVAVTEQRDSSLDAERAWETTMMEACGEDGPASVAAEFKALREQRDALVAESVGLKAICDDRRTFIMNGVQLGFIKVPTVVTDPALETIRMAVSPQQPTPATDAARSSLRAEGIHFTANRLLAAYDHGFINKPAKEVADMARMIITAIDELPTATPEDLTDSYSKQSLAEIARQLRESKGANHE